ncbi:hypothetical protein L2E82_37527 [Cichorium intybus]|uniref:Uncharacterized protein n=1 Tax=Cichorium intybus TaxID=13427 RepID=A0ACB9ADQ8_CICIN|nr:hypothetical protein L2E82_37527 [Cichorium intybus]
MRLSRTAFLSNKKRNQSVIRAKKKHKKLDAICEDTFKQNRDKIEPLKLSEVNDDTSEVRRSSRVRRAPSVLDASPCPPKKRKISNRNVDGSSRRGGDRDRVGLEEEESGEWKSRLRARGRKVTFMNGESSPRSKKKLFSHSDSVKEESDLVDSHLDDKKGGLVGETLMVVQPKRPGRIKASNVVSIGREDISLGNSDKDEEETNVLHVAKDKNKGFISDNGAAIESPNQGNEVPDTSDSKDNANNMVQSPEQSTPVEQEQPESGERENQSLQQEATSAPENHVEDGSLHANHLQEEDSKLVNEDKHSPNHRQHKPRIKKGRCCGMCGGGINGKPPKILVHDGAGSDNEAYSGSSSSEEPTYDLWDGFGDEPGWLGHLLGPINDRFGIAGIWVHQQCAVWSPEVYFAGLGCLKNVRSALCRGRVLKCSRCGRRGATIGCRVDRCPRTYHLPCARVNGCIFDHRKFLIACTDHRHLFQPHGTKYLETLKKIKTKKIKSQMRKISNDASRKDHEAEEKWLENCGEDEEFLKRESKRLHRDLSRIAPVYIGGPSPESPIPFQGWESVGGLQPVIQSLKEVVILPLLYPEFFENVGLTPPRGVLLHGYPGTGKTLVVRSLIGSCARGDKRIAYFARKGADCLGKYVGDAERQLRLLFHVAEKSQPSIIFFDEIDGLAPSRTRQQDQTHNSVVSTLLALLDGLKSRGSVIVIGATNRPDAIDPALRRPGRFDREIYFPLPGVKDREEILSLHTNKWPSVMDKSLLKLIAKKTVGFAGADLQALCTQTAIIALKRRCPWEKLLSCAEEKGRFGKRPVLPSFTVHEKDWLEAIACAPPPCSRREAGMAANDIATSVLPVYLLPCLIRSVIRFVLSLYLDGRVSLPGSLLTAAETVKTVIVNILGERNERSDCWWLKVEDLMEDADVASEVEIGLVRAGVLVGNDDNGASLKVHDGFFQNDLYKKQKGFCVLISGSQRSGQRHLASCVLQCFVGNAVLQKVDLATMLQEGAGDMVQGLSQILVRCAGVGSCMIFMPRIDLWAVSTKLDEEENETKIPPILNSSDLWSSFVEQAESIFISSSLMILATSEVPFELLPLRIKDFFGKTNKQNLNPSSHTGTTIPRFSVNVDQSFDRETVIASSAKKLSNDVARYFVELTHQKSHETTIDADVDTDTPIEEYTFQNQNPSSLPPTTKKEEKGKSNLLLAISTFGYQILQYPQFAELCWVTSKLKEGPSAETDGPWKGWPFNSCIIRPSATSAKLAVGGGSGNGKSKEKYGLVHGLIAVGLMAYRGVYTSLREVSGDVRKVLEILTSQITARVEGGKDRRQFGRVLSQVAYFEDLVNSWAYTLQSLETPPQVLESKTAIVQSNEHMDKPSHSESMKENTEPLDDKLNEGDKSTDHVASVDESMKENTEPLDDKLNEGDKSTDHVASVDESNSVIQTQESTSFKDPQIAHILKDSNEVVLESSKYTEHSNGFTHDVPSTSDDQILSNSTNNNQVTQTGECLYRFCPECMSNLQNIIQTKLISSWDKKNPSDLTTEDVHETVTSLSLNLYKRVRTFFLQQETRTCQCEDGCHSGGGDDRCRVPGDDLDLELIYKNGVVVMGVGVLDPEKDVCFHCKFERLCLCSVIEYIVVVMTKQQPSG